VMLNDAVICYVSSILSYQPPFMPNFSSFFRSVPVFLAQIPVPHAMTHANQALSSHYTQILS